MPGEQFTGAVMINAIGVVVGLLGKGFAVVPHNFHCSNVYIARNHLAQMALSIEQGDYIVWMDDDNIANVNQVRKLIEELDSHPEADMVAGWTWIQADFASCGPKASCGIFDEKGFLKTNCRNSIATGNQSCMKSNGLGSPWSPCAGKRLSK